MILRKIPLVLCLICFLAISAADRPAATLNSFTWLLGTWVRQHGSEPQFERWIKVNPAEFQGTSFVLKGRDTLVTERMRLLASDTGLFYEAEVPHNKAAVSFELAVLDSATAVFENLQHDYPQRIIYTNVSPDSLHARIEGSIKGTTRGVDFLFSRAK